MSMGIVIKYQLPLEIFNENKRPPGHICDPLIRQAARTARKVLEDLGLPHRIRYVDQRDEPRADTPIAFYGVQINLEGPGENREIARYGWTRLWGDRWSPAQSCMTHIARDFPAAHASVAHVIEAWRKKGLVTSLHDDGGYLPEHDAEALANEHPKVSTPM